LSSTAAADQTTEIDQQPQDTTGSDTGFIVIGCIAALVCIIATVVGIVCWKRKSNKTRDSATDTPMTMSSSSSNSTVTNTASLRASAHDTSNYGKFPASAVTYDDVGDVRTTNDTIQM
jgi:hypothetical protein